MPISERRLIFLIGAVQFVNILDFMMVMPLGPDLGRALGIPSSELGLIGGSYVTAARTPHGSALAAGRGCVDAQDLRRKAAS